MQQNITFFHNDMYIFDTSTFIVIFRNYYIKRFPSFWSKFNEYVESGLIVSTREVQKEFVNYEDNLLTWSKSHMDVFPIPIAEELFFIQEIYSVQHFKKNMGQKKFLLGGPFADPFVIAKAKIEKGIVVTQERFKDNGAKIPNICKYFETECIDLEGFLTKEEWTF